MPAPATPAELAAVVRSSRLVAPDDLRAALDGSPGELLARLVASGALTPFQAGELGRGRWDGFDVGPYRVLDLLGAGGMGRVFLARHTGTGQQVAVKVLSGGRSADPVARARFVREAQTSAAIDHPHVVRVLDADVTGPRPFLVMEYVPAVSLQAAVAARGPVPPGLAADLARQVALGLQAAHERGLVHRDVKPANVLLDQTGRARLFDLGVVKTDEPADDSTVRTGRTILGTVDYLAPEQALDSSAVDTRADLYALGGTLYFLLAGRSPFPAGPPHEVFRAKFDTDPAPVTDGCADCSPELAAVVGKLLARRRGDRFQTPRAAAEALAGCAHPDPAHVRRVFHADTLADGCAATAAAPTAVDLPAAAPAGPPTEVLALPAGPLARLLARLLLRRE